MSLQGKRSVHPGNPPVATSHKEDSIALLLTGSEVLLSKGSVSTGSPGPPGLSRSRTRPGWRCVRLWINLGQNFRYNLTSE